MHSAIQRFLPNGVIITLGIAATVTAASYGVLGEDGRLGPGFLPAVAGSLMAVFAVVNTLTSGKKHGATLESVVEERIPSTNPAENTQTMGTDGDDRDIYGRTQRQRDKMLWTVMGIMLATVLLVPLLGFMLAFATMLVVIAVVVERRKILSSVAVSAATLAATYATFVLFLRVPLPQGILGI